jgi:hypothetical protein
MSDYSQDDNVAQEAVQDLSEGVECGDNHDNKPQVIPNGEQGAKVLRDPVTGKFLPGTARGPGRPHGAKSQFNKQVIDSLQALWERDGARMLEQLAAEKPEVVMGMVSRMIPQALAAEAITGEDGDKSNQINDIRVTLVHKQDEPALPAREVEGELLPKDSVH